MHRSKCSSTAGNSRLSRSYETMARLMADCLDVDDLLKPTQSPRRPTLNGREVNYLVTSSISGLQYHMVAILLSCQGLACGSYSYDVWLHSNPFVFNPDRGAFLRTLGGEERPLVFRTRPRIEFPGAPPGALAHGLPLVWPVRTTSLYYSPLVILAPFS